MLNPRWYVAERSGFVRASFGPGRQVYETVVGFRPNRHQIVKIGYEVQQGPAIDGMRGNTLSAQLVTNFHAISLAGD